MSVFLPITKVDARQRLVYGTLSEEVPDKGGEILDYASAKPAFQAWSGQFHAASGGKSFGNVRSMHTRIAAGKFTDIDYDDENKRISGVAKIIDEDEWEKVLEGVYTGFSIGGGYARRWPDPENPSLMRYTPVLAEVSLVDNPAVPTATFQVIKQDGSVEMRKFEQAAPAEAESANTPMTAQLLTGLSWLASHAEAIGALGLLAHIVAIKEYLEETDEGDAIVAPGPDAAKAAITTLQENVNALQKRIGELEAQPMPAKGALRTVGKAEDHGVTTQAEPLLKNADRVNALMKAALARPIAL